MISKNTLSITTDDEIPIDEVKVEIKFQTDIYVERKHPFVVEIQKYQALKLALEKTMDDWLQASGHKPYHQHDCQFCRHLSSISSDVSKEKVDLYYCVHDSYTNIVARFSSIGPDYTSNTVEVLRFWVEDNYEPSSSSKVLLQGLRLYETLKAQSK